MERIFRALRQATAAAFPCPDYKRRGDTMVNNYLISQRDAELDGTPNAHGNKVSAYIEIPDTALNYNLQRTLTKDQWLSRISSTSVLVFVHGLCQQLQRRGRPAQSRSGLTSRPASPLSHSIGRAEILPRRRTITTRSTPGSRATRSLSTVLKSLSPSFGAANVHVCCSFNGSIRDGESLSGPQCNQGQPRGHGCRGRRSIELSIQFRPSQHLSEQLH